MAASGGCEDAFAALVGCVAAADDGSGTPPTTQPLPCLDAADSLRKCMKENAGKYAYTLDLVAAAAGAGVGEADADDFNHTLVFGVTNMQRAHVQVQEAVTEIELRARERKACKDALVALKECVAGLGAGGMTMPPLRLSCLEAWASVAKCVEGIYGEQNTAREEYRRCRQVCSMK